MKVFSYSIICEDIAHSTFTNEILNFSTASNPNFSFKLNFECFKRWKFSNKSDVLKNYADISARSFKEYGVNLLFVIADFDDWDVAKFDSYHTDMFSQLQTDIKDRTLILLPVRSVEFWLYHIKWKVDNPGSTKNIQIEDEKRAKMKELVYGTKKPYKELSEKTVQEIMKHFNPDWLCSRSKSFNHFYINLTKFLQL